MERGCLMQRAIANERKSALEMVINSTGRQPGQGAGERDNRLQKSLPHDVVDELSAISLRCVECSALYPVIESDTSTTSPRYRCDCGGVLDVEASFRLPGELAQTIPNNADLLLDLDN